MGRAIVHQHFTPATNSWEGWEESGLVPGRRLKPDGYHAASKTVYLFHGNYWHGFPPDDRRYNTAVGVNNRPAAELFAATEADMRAYCAAGYTVLYAWEHDWQRLLRGELILGDVVRVFV